MAPREVYLDNSATKKVDPRVTEAMLPYFSEKYGHPNSLHKFGREARAAVDNARAQVAALINAKPSDIIFTGAGSEPERRTRARSLAPSRANVPEMEASP